VGVDAAAFVMVIVAADVAVDLRAVRSVDLLQFVTAVVKCQTGRSPGYQLFFGASHFLGCCYSPLLSKVS